MKQCQQFKNSLGVNKISDHLLTMISKLGKESITKEGYVDKAKLKENLDEFGQTKNPTDAELNGIKELADVYNSLGADGFYKMINSESTQRNHLNNAFNYLWALLPNNAKNVLNARHIVSGTSVSNPTNILKSALLLHTNHEVISKLDWETGMNKVDKEGNSTDPSSKTYNQSPLEKLINADLDVRDDIVMYNADNTDYGFKFKGTLMSSLPTLDGKPSKPAPLGKSLQDSLWGVIDKEHIYFGANKVQPYELDKIIYNGGLAANIWVPVSNGVPNFSLLKKLSKCIRNN